MRPLHRPMFRYGGPIKQGIMSGIREPKRNGGSMTQRVQPSTDGSRPGYAGPAAIPLMIGLNALRQGAMRLGSRYIMPMLRKQTGSIGAGTVKIPGKVGTKGRFLPQNVKNVEKLGPPQATFEPTWLGRDPLVRTIGATGKAIFNPTVGGWAGKGVRFATSPSTLIIGGLYYANGRWFNKDGSPANENDIAAAKASTGGPPGGGDQGMQGTGEWFAAEAEKESNIAKQKAWDNRIKKYRDIMDIKGMNKEAAYNSLIDASKLIQESGDFKGDIKSGKLINQVIQAASKQFDKPSKTSDAINTLILQNELKKDLESETNKDKKTLLKKQIQIADKTLEGATFSEVITDRIKRGEVPTGNTLATILRATEGIDAKVIPSSKLGEGEDPISFLTKQVDQAKKDGTLQPGAVVISSRVLIVDEEGNITPFL
jgi:hypothetical protein